MKRKKKIKNNVTQLENEEIFKLIDPNTEIVVVAPWNGKMIPVTIRMLDSVALSSCGTFNTVTPVINENDPPKEEEKQSIEDMVKVKNIHENILKLALVHPTFSELEEHLMKKDFFTQTKREIEEIKTMIDSLKSVVEKQELSSRLEQLELSIAFLLPMDFTIYLVSIIMQLEATDLNKLSKDTLLQAGFLGEKYNVRPSEYIEGTFTEKQRTDIDVTALTLVSDYRHEQELEQSNIHWIRGK